MTYAKRKRNVVGRFIRKNFENPFTNKGAAGFQSDKKRFFVKIRPKKAILLENDERYGN